MTCVADFIERLRQLPPEWRISATKSGSSVEAWDPGGTKYAFVFTDGRPTRWMTNRTDWRNQG